MTNELPTGARLNFAGRWFTDRDLEALPVRSSYPYETVDFSQNDLSARGLQKVLDLCLGCSKLRVLKLFKNNIDNAGASDLARFLRKCTTIEEIHLSHNRFTAEGVTAIVSAAEETRAKGMNPLWLRLEQNDVQEPLSVMKDLQSRFSVCARRDRHKCTVRTCVDGRKVHLPHFSFQRGGDQGDDIDGGGELRRKRRRRERWDEEKEWNGKNYWNDSWNDTEGWPEEATNDVNDHRSTPHMSSGMFVRAVAAVHRSANFGDRGARLEKRARVRPVNVAQATLSRLGVLTPGRQKLELKEASRVVKEEEDALDDEAQSQASAPSKSGASPSKVGPGNLGSPAESTEASEEAAEEGEEEEEDEEEDEEEEHNDDEGDGDETKEADNEPAVASASTSPASGTRGAAPKRRPGDPGRLPQERRNRKEPAEDKVKPSSPPKRSRASPKRRSPSRRSPSRRHGHRNARARQRSPTAPRSDRLAVRSRRRDRDARDGSARRRRRKPSRARSRSRTRSHDRRRRPGRRRRSCGSNRSEGGSGQRQRLRKRSGGRPASSSVRRGSDAGKRRGSPLPHHRGTFQVTIQRGSNSVRGPLGIDIRKVDGVSLLVDRVNDGLIADWNAAHGQELQVRVGDRIVEVNGLSGDAKKIFDACRSEKVLKLLFQRAGPEKGTDITTAPPLKENWEQEVQPQNVVAARPKTAPKPRRPPEQAPASATCETVSTPAPATASVQMKQSAPQANTGSVVAVEADSEYTYTDESEYTSTEGGQEDEEEEEEENDEDPAVDAEEAAAIDPASK